MTLFFPLLGVKTVNILELSILNSKVRITNYNKINQWNKKQILIGVLEIENIKEMNGLRQKYLGRVVNIGNILKYFCF